MSTNATVKREAERGKDGIYRYTFDSLHQAMDSALNGNAAYVGNETRVDDHISDSLRGGDKWGNYYTKEKMARDTATTPQHLTDAVAKLRDKLIDVARTPMGLKRKVRHGRDDGEAIDADRFLERNPDMWDKSVREPSVRRTVTIGINISILGIRTPEEMLWRGAAALALTDLLTERGFNVGINLYSVADEVTRQGVACCIEIVAKDPLMPVDASAVTFAACEIAWTRIAGVLGRMRLMPHECGGKWGRTTTMPDADRKKVDFLIESTCLREGKSTEWLREQCQMVNEKYGQEL